jgi:gamma-glutamylcyclotransferase (GGCT)/AIG2-like uncharacterized protein YtfP
MNPHLFVYGSLLSGAGHPKGERLRREAQLRGAATMQGQLYKVTWYPAAVAEGGLEDRVHGEVYKLAAPARVFEWLDAYEGIDPAHPEANDYERVEQQVRLASGEEIKAWVYLYRKDVWKLGRIPDGRWSAQGP